MAITHAGDRFENPATRETGRIITGAGDTDGRYMQSETRVRPGGAVSVAHRHRECTERFEAMVVTLFALATEGRTDDKGRPSPLQMAVILDEYDDVLELVGPPRWLQRLGIPLLARIARARGLRAVYAHHADEYSRWQATALS